METVPIGDNTQYVPAPMTTEQVAALHHDLWMALVMMPKHKHRSNEAREDCSTCSARKYLNAAYKGLPSGHKTNYSVVNADEGDEAP